MRYSDLKISFDRPYIWKRPTADKLPKKGQSFLDVSKTQYDFEILKEQVGKEISGAINKSIDKTVDINGINQGIGEVCEFYGKAVIATDDIEPGMLLSKTNKNTLNKKLQGWCQNLVFNIPNIIDSTPYNDLINKFTDVPAFVCMAGPSLKNNREKLLKAKVMKSKVPKSSNSSSS